METFNFESVLCLWCPFAFTCAIFGAVVGRHYKNRGVEGYFLGLLLGPIGILCAFLLPMQWTRKSPYCLSGIPRAATRCRQCAAELLNDNNSHGEQVAVAARPS